MNQLRFLNRNQINEIQKDYISPVYVYSENQLLKATNEFLDFPSAF
jgi:diaminopimelate decarboxylase